MTGQELINLFYDHDWGVPIFRDIKLYYKLLKVRDTSLPQKRKPRKK
jgi:hypothetical protein